jgi:hypothetical protein
MKNRKTLLPALLAIVLFFSLILPASVAGGSAVARSVSSAIDPGRATPMVAAGFDYTVGLRSDGTVVALGNNLNGQCNVGNWTDIIQVAAGGSTR